MKIAAAKYYPSVAAAMLALLLAAGCASKKGPFIFQPIANPEPGFSTAGRIMSYTGREVKISIRPLMQDETKELLTKKDLNNPISDVLTGAQYIAFLLDIENLSKSDVMYNPALTTLFDSDMGVHKPLDYADMYMLAGKFADPEGILRKMKGQFYDLTTTIGPGRKTSRLLMFYAGEAELQKASIAMKEVYIGTETVALTFDFKADEGPRK